MEESSELPEAVNAVLVDYCKIRNRQRQSKVGIHKFWLEEKQEGDHPDVGSGTEQVRSAISRSIVGPKSAAMREALLLEAARRGYMYLVRELLYPSSDDCTLSNTSLDRRPPVSIYFRDNEGNNIMHLAVLSGNVKLVEWLFKISRDDEEIDDTHWAFSTNFDLESAFSLAIRRGNLRIVNAFCRLDYSSTSYTALTKLNDGIAERLGCSDLFEGIKQGNRTIEDLQDHTADFAMRDDIDNFDQNFSSLILCALVFLLSRCQAHSVIRDTIDDFLRPAHLKKIVFETRCSRGKMEQNSLEKMKQHFQGIFRPWWDPKFSNFDLDKYISTRTEYESDLFFHLLKESVSLGQFNLAIWWLTHFKAPPSLLSLQKTTHFDGDWYLRNTTKLMDIAVIGWTDGIAKTFVGNMNEHFFGAKRIIQDITGSMVSDNSTRYFEYDLIEMMWEYSFDESNNEEFSFSVAWKRIFDLAPNVSSDREHCFWFGVPLKNYSAVKLACTARLEVFEESSQAKLLSHLLDTVYNDDPNFVSADLVNLSHFAALDHLPLFQFLTKKRYLDLNAPLLCPLESLSDFTVDDDTVVTEDDDQEIDNHCSICLERISDPYRLKCGHSFHHKCIFWHIFPSLRDHSVSEIASDNDDGDAPDQDRLTHEVLAEHSALSFTLGKTNCPYCRQSVKPDLSEAFALNLADGLRRTAVERRMRPTSPHIDLSKCKPGITVGEALLAFAACSGAVNIFQWLVSECGIMPEDVKPDGLNLMHHAVVHNQILVVRWLCENGHSDMLFGGMEREAFDCYVPSIESGTSLGRIHNILDLDGTSAERIKLFERETRVSVLRGQEGDNPTYSEFEVGILEEGPCKEEEQLIELRRQTRQQSPVHQLLMDYDSLMSKFFSYLRSKEIPAVPANWYEHVLALSVDSTIRSDAKAFLSQRVLSVPECLRGESLHDALPKEKAFSFDTVLADPEVGTISPFVMGNDIDRFNLWKMLLRAEKDWKPFLQVAKTLDVFVFWGSFEIYEDSPCIFEDMTAFVGAIIECGRVDILTAFSTMRSFCNRVGLFDNDYNSTAVMLRPMIKERGKTEIFVSFLDHIDQVKQIKLDLRSLFRNVVKGIASGKSIVELEEDVNRVTNKALELSGIDEPLGTGSEDDVRYFLDLSRRNWLNEYFLVDKENIKLFDLVAERRDRGILHWALSQAKNHEINTRHGGEEGFVWNAYKAIIKKGDLFTMKEFVLYVTEGEHFSQYYGNKEKLMEFLLDPKGESIPDFREGGMLGYAFSNIIGHLKEFEAENKNNSEYEVDAGPTKEKIERMYDIVGWILNQEEVISTLSVREKRAIYASNVLDGLRMSFADYFPHETFRILKLMNSKIFDLRKDFENPNLIQLVFEWDSSSCSIGGSLPAGAMEVLRENSAYKDGNGTSVQTLSDLIRWLALEIMIDIQHVRYEDLPSPPNIFGSRDPIVSEEEFNSLKQQQQQLESRNLRKLKTGGPHSSAV